MNKNSYFSDFPPQPNNPTDEERYFLARYALTQEKRPEDFEYIRKVTSPPPDITTIVYAGSLKGVRVAVVGGGLAGMAAAFELRKLGCDITVLDAEERIGGRVYTYYFDENRRYYAEMGAARLPVTHETTWHYINLFKLDTIPFIQYNPNSFIYLRGVRVRNDPEGRNVQRYIYPKYNLTPQERSLSWQELINYGFENNLFYLTPEVRSEILQVLRNYSPQILNWDFNSIRRMSELSGLSYDALNLVSNFIISAGANLFASFLDYIQEPYSVDLSFVYQLTGGNVNLPLAFYKSFNSAKPEKYYNLSSSCLGSIEWKGSHSVTGIYLDPEDSRPVITYKALKRQRCYTDKFDYIVCAIPFSTLRNVEIKPLFCSQKMQAIKEVYYTPTQKSALFCNNRFWEKGGTQEQILGGISYTDLPVAQLLYPSYYLYENKNYINTLSRNTRVPERGGVLVSYNFNLDSVRLANMPAKERLEDLKNELEDIHGLPKNSLNSIVTRLKTVNWNSEPWFRGGLCLYTPEQRRLYAYASACPEYNGRVFFAGEHVSAKHRWIQGALKSGMDAANQLASSVRHTKKQ